MAEYAKKKKKQSIFNNKDKILQMKNTIPSNLYLIKHVIFVHIFLLEWMSIINCKGKNATPEYEKI